MPQFASLPLEILTMILSHHFDHIVTVLRDSLSKATLEVAKSMKVCKTWANTVIHILYPREDEHTRRIGYFMDARLIMRIAVRLFDFRTAIRFSRHDGKFLDAMIDRLSKIKESEDLTSRMEGEPRAVAGEENVFIKMQVHEGDLAPPETVIRTQAESMETKSQPEMRTGKLVSAAS